LLAVLVVVLGAVGFGWAMGWYQGRDDVERERRRASRAEAREQAQADRQARKDAAREANDKDDAGNGFPATTDSPTVDPQPDQMPPAEQPQPTEAVGGTDGGGGAPAVHAVEAVQAPLMIQCMPWCDAIQVDGEAWGGSPVLDRSIAVGHHQIQLHAAAGDEANVDVEVTADGTKLCWDFNLGGACTSP